MTLIRRITTTDPLYPQACELRDRVLLLPIGYSMGRFLEEYPKVDSTADHFVAVTTHHGAERVVGVVVLVPPEGLSNGVAGVGKLMQMAVEPQLQGKGIGRRLVVDLEAFAFGEQQYESLYCHARLDAVEFYLKLGWKTVGERFDEAGIGHYRMEQRAS